MVEVLIVGGSVAGLSAALLLARCRRSVLVCDAGRPRNRSSRHMHGFISREGVSPAEFLKISRDQVASFPNVTFFGGTITSIRGEPDGFYASAEDGTKFRTRTILLATGIIDELPEIPGIASLYGKSVHHCPYCDGWEHRDQPIAVCGGGSAGVELAVEMLLWSKDLTYCANGDPVALSIQNRLSRLGIRIVVSRLASLEGSEGQLEKIVFSDGTTLSCRALFFAGPQHQKCDLAQQLGCELDEGEFIVCDDGVKTCVPGVYSAGNASEGLQLAIVAAAEGAKAAHAINVDLMERDNPLNSAT